MNGFSAWKEGAIHYVPTILLSLGCLYLASRGYRGAWVGVAVFGFYGLFSLFFFRDPPREIVASPEELVAPADGTVVGIEELSDTPHFDGPCKRVSIFLSVMNVHVNRSPIDGTVKDVRYQEGKYKNAMRADSSQLNESNAVWLETPRGPMTVRQISGAVARRIVCRCKPGDALKKGERFGMIKLGSRTELYLPPTAEVCVRMKQKVRAGKTIIARFP